MTEVIKPKVRCSYCLKWFEPDWKFHEAHKSGDQDCWGLNTGSLMIPHDHLIAYCECGHKKIKPVEREVEG